MAKWKLMLTSTPIALGVVAIKINLIEALNFEGWVELNDIALVVSAGVFLIGFMLAGTMADYKESERIPGEIAPAIESIEETCINLSNKVNFPQKMVFSSCQNLAQQIDDWFLKKVSTEQMFAALHNFNQTITGLDNAGANPSVMSRVFNELNMLRHILTRSSVISRTGFRQQATPYYTQNYLVLSSPPSQEPKVGEAKGLGVVFFSILFKTTFVSAQKFCWW